MNMKGGVGKTTVATNFSSIVSRFDLNGKGPFKVLAIDYDPQFNLSQSFLPSKKYFEIESKKKTTLSVLIDNEDKLDPYQLIVPGNHTPPKVADISTPILGSTSGKGGLDLVPSTLDLMYVALGQATSQVKPIEERFEKFIAEARGLYDLIIIDCHPAGSLFTKTSLGNSDHVIIPVMPQRYAVRGIGLMMNFIESKKIGGSGPVPHILFNAVPRDHISSEEMEIRGNAKYTKYCLGSTLKKFKAFTEVEEGAGYVWKSGKPYSTQAFNNIVSVSREIVTKVGL
jgi:chromosome partitioning protein